MEEELQKELISLFKKYQEIINRNSEELKKVMIENTNKLKKIIIKIGWPSAEIVGEKGELAAWLIVQHSYFDLNFQEKCLQLLKKLPELKERKIHIAYLTDRVLVNKNEKQIYGTQFFRDKNNGLKPHPIKNISGLEKRRKEACMDSFEDYKNKLINKKIL